MSNAQNQWQQRNRGAERVSNRDGMRQEDTSPGYKQISGITSFDNQARNDKNNKIITIIYSFHLVISSFFYVLFISVFVPMVLFFNLIFFLLHHHHHCVLYVSRVQPQITLIILSPFFFMCSTSLPQPGISSSNLLVKDAAVNLKIVKRLYLIWK